MSETYAHWRYAKEKVWESYEDCQPFKDMGQAAAAVASEESLTRDEFSGQLYKLYEAYSSFLHGTNSGSDSSKWRHWHNHFRDARLSKKLGEPYLSSEMLSGAAHEYLNGAIRVPKMDRALIDALIAQETFAYIDQRAGRGAILTQFGCFGAFVVPAIIWQVLTGEPVNWHRLTVGLGIVAGILALLYLWPRKGMLKLHGAMRDTYHLLSGSVVSVPELRKAVDRARDKGVVWPPELYAMLDDVGSRTNRL
ncbi:MAG: hypothetical protein V4444_04630 [Pseudomonadota bacterium]